MGEQNIEKGNFDEIPVQSDNLVLNVFGLESGKVIHGSCKHEDAIDEEDDADDLIIEECYEKNKKDDHKEIKEEV